MSFRPNPRHPYAHAARLPDGDEAIPLSTLFPESDPNGPFEIEIGPGRGGFMFERCAAAPDVHMLGFEIRLKWAHIVDERLKKAGLGARARVLGEDAKRALPRLVPSASVRAFYLHFPDPWWKKRHEKRLVMGDVLLDQIARLLVPGGTLLIQTDVEERAAQYEAQVGAHTAFVMAGDEPGSPRIADNPFGARSPREHRAIADGLPVHRLLYRRNLADGNV
ncbi:MAG: tRNA (guanine-N7)-methyltransferase [Polyangiaceae bacterium]|nr:tRNA (guanine-N7)-methyltransferase [Polyangiaceae bacterium]